MVANLCYRSDKMYFVISSLQNAQNVFQLVQSEMNKLSSQEQTSFMNLKTTINNYNAAQSALIGSERSQIKVDISKYEMLHSDKMVGFDIINGQSFSLANRCESLTRDARRIDETFSNAESSLAQMIKGATNFISTIPVIGDIIKHFQKSDELNKTIGKALQKIEIAELELEQTILTLIAGAIALRGNLTESLKTSDVIFEQEREYYIAINSIPKSFLSLNVGKLLEENPDIKRKGVMMGFHGEYWDPNKQEQCTFYAAARRTQIGKALPTNGTWGNAWNWGNKARETGVPVSKTPEKGDVFCAPGEYGHVGIVEAIKDDGTIIISEANYGFAGAYNTRTLTPAQYASWEFIH